MIIKTFELIPEQVSGNLLSIDELQTQVNNGDYDDILNSYEFLIMTQSGIALVKKDKSIVINATVDLSKYVLKEEDKSLISNSELQRLSEINNYDDNELRNKISNIHTHDNLELLNQITPEMIDALNTLIQNK